MNFRVHYINVDVTCNFFHAYPLLLFSALNVGVRHCHFCFFFFMSVVSCFLLLLLPGFCRSLCTCQRTKHCRGRTTSAASRVPCLFDVVEDGYEKTGVEGAPKTRVVRV